MEATIGKITANGILEIQRGSELKAAECENYHLNPCSDACSKFGEPQGTGPYTLTLCEGTVWTFQNFTDDRT